MRSSPDSFWNAVGVWSSGTRKPWIVVEGRGGGNWPVVRFKGTVLTYTPRESITFISDDGKVWPLDLRACNLFFESVSSLSAETAVAATFRLKCKEIDGEESVFVFTELRSFGKSD